jgi:hypothetical protein
MKPGTATGTLRPGIEAEINKHGQMAEAKAIEAVEHAISAGKLLIEAKRSIVHGEFTNWIEANLTVGLRQAQRYMEVYRASLMGNQSEAMRIFAKRDKKNRSKSDTVSSLGLGAVGQTTKSNASNDPSIQATREDPQAGETNAHKSDTASPFEAGAPGEKSKSDASADQLAEVMAKDQQADGTPQFDLDFIKDLFPTMKGEEIDKLKKYLEVVLGLYRQKRLEAHFFPQGMPQKKATQGQPGKSKFDDFWSAFS